MTITEHPESFEIIPADVPPGWFTVLRNGDPVWHGPREAVARYVADPEFRKECHRSKKHYDR